MHAARAAFQHIRNGGDADKPQRQLGKMVPNGFAFERDDAQAALGEKGEIGDDEREQQQGVHGSGHGELSYTMIFRLPSWLHNMAAVIKGMATIFQAAAHPHPAKQTSASSRPSTQQSAPTPYRGLPRRLCPDSDKSAW